MSSIFIRFQDNGWIEKLREGLQLKGPMQRAVSRIVQRAKSNAPVRTGRLRRSIAGHVEDSGRRGVIKPSAPYWYFVERGTSRFPGRYYIQRAIDADTAELRSDFERDIKQQIEG
jgi:HK97 gp10 family phage protein